VLCNDNKLRVSKRKSEIQDGGFENSVAQISAYDSNNIPTDAPMFSGSGNTFSTIGVIMYISWDTCNYIMSAAILNFWLPVSSESVTDSTIEKFDPENMG